MKKKCDVCGKEFDARGHAKRCSGICVAEGNRETLRKWNNMPQARERRRKYNNMPKARERRRKWMKTPKGRECQRKWVKTPKGREYQHKLDEQRRYRIRVRHAAAERMRLQSQLGKLLSGVNHG